jgi:hypothetical protein
MSGSVIRIEVMGGDGCALSLVHHNDDCEDL